MVYVSAVIAAALQKDNAGNSTGVVFKNADGSTVCISFADPTLVGMPMTVKQDMIGFAPGIK